MIVPSAGAKCSMRCVDIEAGRFGIVYADSRARVWLEPAKSKSEQRVPHESTSINEARAGAAPCYNPVDVESRVRSASKPIIKEIAFDRRTYYSGTKDIACLKSTEKADIVLRINGERIAEFIAKCSGASTVLKNVSSHVNRCVPTCAKEFRRWRSNIFFDDRFSALNAGARDANRNYRGEK